MLYIALFGILENVIKSLTPDEGNRKGHNLERFFSSKPHLLKSTGLFQIKLLSSSLMERIFIQGENVSSGSAHHSTLSYIVFRMSHSEPRSGVKGKAIYNKNLSN